MINEGAPFIELILYDISLYGQLGILLKTEPLYSMCRVAMPVNELSIKSTCTCVACRICTPPIAIPARVLPMTAAMR